MAFDEEDSGYKTMYQHPVESTESHQANPVTRTEEVVVGSLFASSFASSSPLLTASLLRPKASPAIEESTAFASIPSSWKNVNNPSPVSEVTETTPLIMPCGEHDPSNAQAHTEKKSIKGLCNMKRVTLCSCVGILLLVPLVLITMTMILFYEYKPLSNSGRTVILQNQNDTIIAVETDTITTSKLSLQLILQESQSLHVVKVYSTRCKSLRTHSSIFYSSGTFAIHRAHLILLPTYLVSESTIHIHSYVLNVSIITAQIELYVFRGLSDLKTYADHLKESVYKATVYIKGAGVQNTSTIVNYTVPATDYYFVVVDSTAPVYARFDITVNRNYYDPGDYKQSCEIHDNKVSYPTSFEDTQECVLAHAVYVPGAQWEPADIQITEEPQRNMKTAVIVMSCLGGLCVLSLITTVTFCGFYCLCRRLKKEV